MIRSYISASTLLLLFGLFLFFGIACLIFQGTLLTLLYVLSSSLLAVAGIVQIVSSFFSRPFIYHGLVRLLAGIGTVTLAVLISADRVRFVSFLSVIAGIYFILLSLVKLISFFQSREDPLFSRLYSLFSSLVMIGFSVIFIADPYESIPTIMIMVGVLLIIFSLTYLIDFWRELHPAQEEKKSRRHLRIMLPVAFASLIPRFVLRRLNRASSGGESLPAESPVKDASRPPDVEVFIHVKENGTGMFGHMDLYYRGQVISYGCYDVSTHKLNGGFGEGTLFTVDSKQSYIEYCNNYAKKTIFCFGLRLTPEQMERIDAQLDDIRKYLYPWKPPLAAAQEAGACDPLSFTDYASRLFRVTNAKFYKFTGSSFKTYFVVTTNCVKLADRLLGSSGTDILNLNGFITPGTYYEYLNREYLLQNSAVISREIYLESPQQKP